MRTIHTKKGFTLIEILIVVSIIGLLASIIFVGLGSARAKGRDARRIADLRSIQTGLELYFSKNGKYPDTLTTLTAAGIGVTKVPKDPTTVSDYFFAVNSGKDGYVLGATLEAGAGDAVFNSSVTGADLSGQTYVPAIGANCDAPKYCLSF